MKVCTDACLFGAWSSSVVDRETKNILDAGTGTGLLALMIAQKLKGNIDAVEIEPESAAEASNNFLLSPWSNRLKVFNTSLQKFFPGKLYHLIISNPPFYQDDLKSENHKRNVALHSSELGLTELFECVNRLLELGGKFALLLPPRRAEQLESIASLNGYFILRKCVVKQTEKHGPFRIMYLLSKNDPALETICEQITIRNQDNEYTSRFTELLNEYYLFEKKPA
jgi:tRNA1Val (adenine37-N6)-methyltransferase